MVEASTCGGVDASLLEQQLDMHLASTDSLRTSARVRLSAIPSAEEALFNLGMFPFVVSHLFSEVGQHLSAVTELLCLVERLEELHTKVQGVISSPHLATKFLFGVLRWWSLYLNRCVDAFSSESLDAPGPNVPFSIKTIMVELEGGRYVGPILPASFADLVSKTGGRGGGCGIINSSGGGGYCTTSRKRKTHPTGVRASVRVRYDAHLPTLSLQQG